MKGGRWIRLNVGWDDSEWVGLMEPGAQLAWVKLLCYAKAKGVGGSVKAMGPRIAAKNWGVSVRSIEEMEEAARRDGALYRENGTWTVTGWDDYQKPDATNAERQKRWRRGQRNSS